MIVSDLIPVPDSLEEEVILIGIFTGSGNKLEGDWGEIVALGAEISP